MLTESAAWQFGSSRPDWFYAGRMIQDNPAPCPVCGHAMSEHTIVHGAHDTILNCPVSHPGAWDRDAFEPVNEFGMVTRRHPPEDPPGRG